MAQNVEAKGSSVPAPPPPSLLETLQAIDPEEIGRIATMLSSSEGRRIGGFLTANDLIPADLTLSLDHHRRCRAVEELEDMLTQDLTELPWQGFRGQRLDSWH